MSEQKLVKPEQKVVEPDQKIIEVEMNVDSDIQTESAVEDGRVKLDLTQRQTIQTRKTLVRDGEEKKLIQIHEDSESREISYPTPEKAYREKARKARSFEIPEKRAPSLQLQLIRSEPERQVVEVSAPEEALRPSTVIETEEDGTVAKAEQFEASEPETVVFETGEDLTREEDYESGGQQESYTVELERPERPERIVEPVSISNSRPELEDEYDLTGSLDDWSVEIIEEDSGDEGLELLADDFSASLGYEVLGEDEVLHALYDQEEAVEERVVVDLESMFDYRDSVSGSEVVEKLWEDYGVEATVAEVPYFSENSGESWEEGWNSFDMILQMEDMDIENMEYLSGGLYELGDREQPDKRSIASNFDTSQGIEFRESEEFGCEGAYSASEKTEEAWAERYGEEVLELDPMERGVYAAFEENAEFRGAPLQPEDIDFMSKSAVEML